MQQVLMFKPPLCLRYTKQRPWKQENGRNIVLLLKENVFDKRTKYFKIEIKN